MSSSPVISIRARNRGTTRFLIGSTPSTCRASSSSRILRAPRSAVIAVPATPATTIAVTNGANSRTEARMKKPAEAVEGAEQGEEVGRLQARGAEPEGDRRDQHRKPAELQREEELADELARRRGRGAGPSAVIVLPVRIIMFPTCSNRLLAGRNALSATVRTTQRSPLPIAASSGPGNGHPDETLTRHQFISAPSGPHLGATSQVAHPGSPISCLGDDLPAVARRGRWSCFSSRARASRWRSPLRSASSRAAAQALEQLVASLLQLRHVGDVALRAAAADASRLAAACGPRDRRRAPPRGGRSGGGARCRPEPLVAVDGRHRPAGSIGDAPLPA